MYRLPLSCQVVIVVPHLLFFCVLLSLLYGTIVAVIHTFSLVASGQQGLYLQLGNESLWLSRCLGVGRERAESLGPQDVSETHETQGTHG